MDTPLSLGQWKETLNQAVSLGLKNLDISGGEPTLYPGLIELIEAGKALGLKVRINTNGSTITSELAEALLKAGLDEVCISIYSHRPELHNRFCKNSNLWQTATRAVQIFAEVKSGYPRFLLGTMTIILRENYRSFDELVKLHHRLGSQQMGVSYLEGDFSGKYLLNKSEILQFKKEIIPRAVEYCRHLDSRIKNRAINTLRGLYANGYGSEGDMAKGIYWRRGFCNIPKTAAIIMANGDVHPCNIVEYAHQPVMGNLFADSFRGIWSSENWNQYRKALHKYCLFCPVNLYSAVPLSFNPSTSFLVSLYHSRLMAPLRPAARKLRYLYQRR
jgi:radical SAM protein with 4Fe4S-binding SPASM domain